MDRSKTQFSRLLELDRRIRAGEYPNCLTFAADWEVAQKTVQRDIDYLRDQLRAPIEYDRQKKGFYYSDNQWFLPAMNLAEGDLFYILLASKVMEQYRGTPVAGRMEQVFRKIAASLPEKISVAPEQVFSKFSFTQTPAKPVDEAIWTTVVRGVLHSRSVQISYRAMTANRPKDRLVDPCHIANLQGEWYLFAWCHREKMVIQFAIPRILKAELTDRTFTAPAGFDVKKALAGAFGRFASSDRSHTVRLLFDKEVAPWVLEREWCPGQKIKQQKTGEVELSFQATGLFEVFRWVLSWGHYATVLEPKELKDLVGREAGLVGKRRS